MNYPSIDQVIAAIGKHTENPEVISLLDTLGISESDFEPLAGLNSHKLWIDGNHEIQLQFQDIGSLTDIPYHDIGEGPWALTDVIFWSDVIKETKESYGGMLPYNIKFDMSRNEIKALIPTPLFMEEKNIDVWQIGELELVLDYDLKSKKIRCVSLGFPPPLSE